jgi:hypothetical protein
MQRLAKVEVQMVAHFLEAKDRAALFRCSRFAHSCSREAFAWKHAKLVITYAQLRAHNSKPETKVWDVLPDHLQLFKAPMWRAPNADITALCGKFARVNNAILRMLPPLSTLEHSAPQLFKVNPGCMASLSTFCTERDHWSLDSPQWQHVAKSERLTSVHLTVDVSIEHAHNIPLTALTAAAHLASLTIHVMGYPLNRLQVPPQLPLTKLHLILERAERCTAVEMRAVLQALPLSLQELSLTLEYPTPWYFQGSAMLDVTDAQSADEEWRTVWRRLLALRQLSLSTCESIGMLHTLEDCAGLQHISLRLQPSRRPRIPRGEVVPTREVVHALLTRLPELNLRIDLEWVYTAQELANPHSVPDPLSLLRGLPRLQLSIATAPAGQY